ncbi:hypothetical protein J3459_012445 [Metarhizium acridum]|nr:hypothetical protein J3459_012445 [Metarhizium acridum]
MVLQPRSRRRRNLLLLSHVIWRWAWRVACIGMSRALGLCPGDILLRLNFGAARAVVVMAAHFESAQMIPSWNKLPKGVAKVTGRRLSSCIEWSVHLSTTELLVKQTYMSLA